MEQAFIVPSTKMDPLYLGADIFGSEKQLSHLQQLIEKIAAKTFHWEQLLSHLQVPLKQHPLCKISTALERRNLLHLAVLDNRADIVAQLKGVFSLNLGRDAFGLNPIELAQFLRRDECVKILKPGFHHSFLKQPYATFQEPVQPGMELLEYLPCPVYETQQAFEDILAKTQKAKSEDQIPAEKIWMGIYYDEEIEKGIHPPVSIRYINAELGSGVFAEQRIPPCGYVGEYTGMVQERKKRDLKDKVYCLRYTVWEMGGRNFVLDAEKMGNFTRFINHSSQPNLGVQSVYWRGMPRMIFVALKEIQAGTQLTFDYGNSFWKELQSTPKII